MRRPVRPPRRRAQWSLRRSLLLLGGSGAALLGLITLVVVWVVLVSGSLSTGLADEGTCTSAAAEGTDGATLSTSLLPARSVCAWDTADGRQEVVLSSVPDAVVIGALVAIGGGVLVVGGTALAARRGRL
jgi:hypothetical protein